jgi:hypothetical protein
MSNLPSKDIWLVVGAGISRAAPSHIPLWSEMKNSTIASILNVLVDINARQWHNTPDVFQFEQTSADLQLALRLPEIVMECLCNSYLEPAVKTKLRAIIAPSGGTSQPNQCHHLIAKLVSSGKVKGIITSNFDQLLEQALESAKISHQVILPSTTISTPTPLPIYKVHGTINSSEKLAFLSRTYLRGLPEPIVEQLLQSVRRSLIIICGYSGNDVDLFPVIKKAITDPEACNETIVVDPSDLMQTSPYSALKNHLSYIRDTGANYFAHLLNEPCLEAKFGLDSSNADLLPHAEPFECALFVGDALLSAKQYDRAYKYFYLADDIASDAGNRCGRGIATLGRSLCLFGIKQNQRAINELETGRAMLGPIDFEDVESWLGPIGEGYRISSWLMRAYHVCGITALAVSLKNRDLAVKRRLAWIASLHCHPLSWGEQPPSSNQTDELLTIRAEAIAHLIDAYQAFLNGEARHVYMLNQCLEFCHTTGSIPELLTCMSLPCFSGHN